MDRARLLETFLDLVRIDSPTGFELECAQYCADALREAGCSVAFDDSASVTGSDTGNLIAILPGTAPGMLGLSAHFDCVDPCRGVEPVVADGIITSAGDTILGADDKVGLAAAIEAIRVLSESADPLSHHQGHLHRSGGDRPARRQGDGRGRRRMRPVPGARCRWHSRWHRRRCANPLHLHARSSSARRPTRACSPSGASRRSTWPPTRSAGWSWAGWTTAPPPTSARSTPAAPPTSWRPAAS